MNIKFNRRVVFVSCIQIISSSGSSICSIVGISLVCAIVSIRAPLLSLLCSRFVRSICSMVGSICSAVVEFLSLGLKSFLFFLGRWKKGHITSDQFTFKSIVGGVP